MMSTFPLGRLQVRRSGYGAMQLAGPFAFGPPPDWASAIGVLRAAAAAGVDHIDTAQYYGPGVVNDLIRDALYPYRDGLAIVSKVAVRRDDSGAVLAFDDPDQLREGIEDNLRSLRVSQLAAVNLRLPGDGRVGARFDDQLAAMVAARDEGLIAGVGLSNVSLEQLQHAVAGTEIVCVQNMFHLADRRGTPVLEECLSRGIAFVPFCPLGWPRGPENPVLNSPVVVQTAARLGFTPAQVGLQWLLRLAPNVLLIPGTGSVAHLRENLAAEGVTLDDEALRQLDAIASSPSPMSTPRPGAMCRRLTSNRRLDHPGVRSRHGGTPLRPHRADHPVAPGHREVRRRNNERESGDRSRCGRCAWSCDVRDPRRKGPHGCGGRPERARAG